jgi:hypothetical protein
LTYRAGRSLEVYLEDLLPGTAAWPRARRCGWMSPARRRFKKPSDALDVCKVRGFTNVSVKIRQPFEN